MKATYPLQLSTRIDEGRNVIIFDCFEYKPPCVDYDSPDLSAFYPTGRGWERWIQAFQSHTINQNKTPWDSDDDDYRDDDDDSYYTNKMEAKDPNDGFSEDTERTMIFGGISGNFAYSRCLRFRFPFDNIAGIRLLGSGDGEGDKKGCGDNNNHMGAVLVLELSRPPPSDAFAARKVQSRWLRENDFVLTKDWTPKSAASHASRIYLYGGLNELKQTAALMVKLCPRLASMLASESSKNNSLLAGSASMEYSASPTFAISEDVVYGYGEGRSHPIKKYEDLDSDEKSQLRSDYRTLSVTNVEQFTSGATLDFLAWAVAMEG